MKKTIEEIKNQWKTMWNSRFDDKWRAEGIAAENYPLLFVERGTVIVATRDYKPPDYHEIIEHYKASTPSYAVPPTPSTGGWGKFIKTVIKTQARYTVRRLAAPRPPAPAKQQLKKGGRGWLHS